MRGILFSSHIARFQLLSWSIVVSAQEVFEAAAEKPNQSFVLSKCCLSHSPETTDIRVQISTPG